MALSTNQQKQLKTALIYLGAAILSGVICWYIFSLPSSQKAGEAKGLNSELPDGDYKELSSNKLKGYTLDDLKSDSLIHEEEIEELSDYLEGEAKAREEEQKDQKATPIQASIDQYQENVRMIQSYQEPEEDPEKVRMREEIERLKEENEDLQAELDQEDKSIKMMEKSYELAQKYNSAGVGAPIPRPIVPEGAYKPAEPKVKRQKTIEVYAEQTPIISSLSSQQHREDTLGLSSTMEELSQNGFNTVQVGKSTVERNTVRAVVERTTTLKEGESIRLRLLESARIGRVSYPKGSYIIASAQIAHNRMQLYVASLEREGNIQEAKLVAYDKEGQRGIYVPQLDEISALKEFAAGMSNTAVTSVNFNSNAGQQLLSDVARGTLQGLSNFIGEKLRAVKVTLKAGYVLYLMPENSNEEN